MATFRRRSAAGIAVASVVLAMTLVFGFDGFEFVDQVAGVLFWVLVAYAFLRFCLYTVT